MEKFAKFAGTNKCDVRAMVQLFNLDSGQIELESEN